MGSINIDRKQTHLAAVLHGFGEPYRLEQVPHPEAPAGNDLLVKVLAASYCHTDSVFAKGALSQDLPRIGCHEFAGEVVEIGPDCHPGSGISIGTRVGVPGRAYRPCGMCRECNLTGQAPLGYSTFCPRAGNLGLTRDGGFQEYCLVDSRQVAPLPDGLAAAQAASMMCAGLTIWAALDLDAVRNCKKIAIIGAGGGLGHLGVQFAAHLGMEVLAVDANDQSLRLLEDVRLDMGTTGNHVLVADGRKLSPTSMKTLIGEKDEALPTAQLGVDAAIILPESQVAIDLGIELLRNHGTLVVLSFPKKKLEISAHDLVFRDIRIIGSLVGRNQQLRDMLDFVVKHKIKARLKSSPLEAINEMVAESHGGSGGKLVIDMSLPCATRGDCKKA